MEKQAASRVISEWEESKSFFKSLRVLFFVCGFFLFKPVEAFRQLAEPGCTDIKKRLRTALFFAVTFGYFKLLFDVLNIYWLKNLSKEVLSSSFFAPSSLLSSSSLSSPFFLLRPLIVLGLTFAVVALSVKILLGFKKPVYPALLVVCYKSAADIFFCIPFFGSILAAVWSILLIFIGIREIYRIDTLRTLMTAILMPFIILFFILLSLGPTLNRMIMDIYPEMKSQVIKLNGMSAYSYTDSIVSAAQAYKKELGFYPAHLGVLKKYISGSFIDDVSQSGVSDGYFYIYERKDDAHFILNVAPEKINESGEFIFYADERGGIRLGGVEGQEIKSLEDLSSIKKS